MTIFSITDLPKNKTVRETFLDGEVCVISHSGLHPAERLLIGQLARSVPVTPALLVAGNRTGATALAARARFPESAVTCHAFDLHHARALLRNLAANGNAPAFLHDPHVTVTDDLPRPSASPDTPATAFRVACTARIPPGGYGAAFFMATPGTMTGELMLDQLEDIHGQLADGGVCVVACETEGAPLLKQIKTLFGNVSVVHEKKDLLCATAVKRAPLAKPRDFSAAFPASLPGGEPVELRSLPGVFCHRRPDMGGLALAEVAARELAPEQHVLDMGCGCGLVGILLARSQPGVRVTFIDSHARALEATRRNLDALGMKGHTLFLSDTGTAENGFDLFVGNPPYYSDFKIADLFIDTASRVLRPGGTCLLVAKSAGRLADDARAAFGNAETQARRGYGVARSLRA